MSDNGDKFWDQLLREVEVARAREPISVQEAARRMESAGEAPLGAGRIDRIVRAATAIPEPGASNGAVSGGRLIRRRFWNLPRAAAAAGVLAVSVAVGVGVWANSSYSTLTLGFDDAISILVDPGEEIGRRWSAQGRVHMTVKDGISALKDLEQEGGQLGASSARALQSLGMQLAGELSHPLTEVGVEFDSSVFDLLDDPDVPLAERQRQARILVEHMRNGITALTRASDPELEAQRIVSLEILRAALGQ